MNEDVKKLLGSDSETESDLHAQLRKECTELMKKSRSRMSKKYEEWDLYNDVYAGVRQPDDKDIKARERKEPEKMVVPMTHAQVEAFVAFCFQLFTQRPTFFEMVGMGVEDWKPAKIAESVLQRDLDHNKFLVHLYRFLLNIGRFGIGIFEHSWTKETAMQWQNTPRPSSTDLGGVQLNFEGQQMQLQSVVKFLGNWMSSVNPYRWFPDPAVDIFNFQEGEFCASEKDVSNIWLRKQEKYGILTGTKDVKDMPSSAWEHRLTMGMRSDVSYDRAEGKQKGGVIFTTMQREIIPCEYKIDGGKKLGEEDYPIKYVICLANDTKVVKCEPMHYLHDHYTYSTAQLTPDDQRYLSSGIAELIQELQSVMTWLYNTRISSVRKVIQDRLIVDPQGVNMDDVADRKSVIRLEKGASRSGVDRWIKALPVQDVTQNHVQDALALGSVMQLVTGINENALGQYSTGRRSAEQTRAVNSGAASRLKMFATLIWTQGLQPLGEDLLSNLRDGLDVEQLVRVLGMQTLSPMSPYAANLKDLQSFMGITKADLVGNYDFQMMDGTLPSEKYDKASYLDEILMAILTNPQAAAVLGLDARAIMTESAELKGLRNPERFFLQPAQQQAMMQAAMVAQKPELALPAGSAGITSGTAAQAQNPLEQLQAGALQLPQFTPGQGY